MEKIIRHFENIIDEKKSAKLMEGSKVFTSMQVEKEIRKIIPQDDKVNALMKVFDKYIAI